MLRCRWRPAMTIASEATGLRRVDAAEAVPERRAGAGHQHLQIALLLELAVDRDARQRHQVLAVHAEQDAGSRRHRGLEAELGGDAEFARAGRGRIADRI